MVIAYLFSDFVSMKCLEFSFRAPRTTFVRISEVSCEFAFISGSFPSFVNSSEHCAHLGMNRCHLGYGCVEFASKYCIVNLNLYFYKAKFFVNRWILIKPSARLLTILIQDL